MNWKRLLLLSLWYRAGVMMQPRYAASVAQQQQQQQSSAAIAAGYQYYTPVFNQYPSVAVPPPATWIQPTVAATPAVTHAAVANHYVLPQQLHQMQPAVCTLSFFGWLFDRVDLSRSQMSVRLSVHKKFDYLCHSQWELAIDHWFRN